MLEDRRLITWKQLKKIYDKDVFVEEMRSPTGKIFQMPRIAERIDYQKSQVIAKLVSLEELLNLKQDTEVYLDLVGNNRNSTSKAKVKNLMFEIWANKKKLQEIDKVI